MRSFAMRSARNGTRRKPRRRRQRRNHKPGRALVAGVVLRSDYLSGRHASIFRGGGALRGAVPVATLRPFLYSREPAGPAVAATNVKQEDRRMRLRGGVEGQQAGSRRLPPKAPLLRLIPVTSLWVSVQTTTAGRFCNPTCSTGELPLPAHLCSASPGGWRLAAGGWRLALQCKKSRYGSSFRLALRYPAVDSGQGGLARRTQPFPGP
jgi:hypothetical protein